MTSTRVIVMRHGQSESNVPPVWTSSPIGYPLTELGREQAQAAGNALVGRGVAALYASTLVRAQQTAAEVGTVLGLDLVTLEGLEEIHVGVHEGGHDEDVGPVAIEVFGRWWRDGDLTHGFEGGETGHEVTERMSRALGHVVREQPGRTSVVISHGGAMVVGLTELCSNIGPEFSSENLLANTDTIEVVHDAGEWRCELWKRIPPG